MPTSPCKNSTRMACGISSRPRKQSRRSGRHQFAQRTNDAIGLHGRPLWQAVAMHVDPDRIDAEPLRHLDFPFQIVTDHPGVARGDAERCHGMVIGALLGLAETMLA